MRYRFLTLIAGLVFTLTLASQTTAAQSVPAKDASLIAHLVKEANQSGSHTADDVYLSVTIGKTRYVTALKSGKLISQSKAEYASGGFSGAYAEVRINPLDKNKGETSQGSGQILKLTGNKWKRLALNESDYQCADVKSISKSILKTLKVECN